MSSNPLGVAAGLGGGMAAHAQVAPSAQMTIRRKLIDKLERSEVPNDTKASFKTMVVTLLKAREGDEELAEPNTKSFKLLLEFYSQPTRRMWMLPSMAINPEGIFIAAWGIPGDDWLVTFDPSGGVTWKYLKRKENGEVVRLVGKYDEIDYETGPPIVIPKRPLAA